MTRRPCNIGPGVILTGVCSCGHLYLAHERTEAGWRCIVCALDDTLARIAWSASTAASNSAQALERLDALDQLVDDRDRSEQVIAALAGLVDGLDLPMADRPERHAGGFHDWIAGWEQALSIEHKPSPFLRLPEQR